jgi:DNA end-binding protein Ku
LPARRAAAEKTIAEKTIMAPRTTWRGHLVLARLSCPVRVHLAVVRSDRLGLQGLNRATLNRLQMRPHDPQTGKEVARDFIVRGYEVEPGQFVLLEDRELAGLQIESSRTLVLERFVERSSLDTAYFDTPHFLVPEGRGADAAFGIIRDAMLRQNLVAISRIVLGSRERAVVIETRGKGMLLTTLRAAHEVRSDESYVAEIDQSVADESATGLAERVISRLVGSFDPRRDVRDRYQEALFHFLQAKRKGEKPVRPAPSVPVAAVDPREALEASVAAMEQAMAAPPGSGATSRRASRRTVRSP